MAEGASSVDRAQSVAAAAVSGPATWRERGVSAFVVDRGELRRNLSHFRAAFPSASVWYALKANPLPAVLSELADAGCGFEAASWPEIDALLSLGISPDRVIYGTAVKPRVHVERAARAGVDRFAADSGEELQMLAAAAPGSRVFVRAKLDDSRSVFQMNVKFGVPIGEVVDLVRQAAWLGLHPWGVSFNVGSQATRASQWADGVRALAPTVHELLASGIRLEVLNIGGGFPVPYAGQSDIALTNIASLLDEALDTLPYRPRVIVEPGRRLVATAVQLVATVIARIERPDGPWLFLDCGVYNALYEALLHQGRTAYPVTPARADLEGAPELTFVLAGPTGDGLDLIARDVRLPGSLAEGDQLVFHHAGAYTLALASAFNGFAPPPVVVREKA